MIALLESYRLNKLRRKLPAIRERVSDIQKLDDTQLKQHSLSVRHRVRAEHNLESLIPEMFSLVDESIFRSLGFRFYDVQLLAGMALIRECIAEMQTGEGKTLTAALPLTAFAFAKGGAHLATANDYLARRDAELLRPVYERLGLSVCAVTSESSLKEKRAAYRCDITYGTLREFAFDFLRDRMAGKSRGQNDRIPGEHRLFANDRADRWLQTTPQYLLLDEADSLLIDEARIPFILSDRADGDPTMSPELFQWAQACSPDLKSPRDYSFDERLRKAILTDDGRIKLRASLPRDRLKQLRQSDFETALCRAIGVTLLYQKGRDYIVREGEVVLVDQFTGRPAEGRQLRDGQHQAIEIKEGVELSPATLPAARITVQKYLEQYPHKSGMTGTAREAARELARLYSLGMVTIPTHRPVVREEYSTIICVERSSQQAAIAKEIEQITLAGRPVLVGTKTIEESLELSRLLTEHGLDHQVLNGIQDAVEARIVSEAGRAGRITVATNMAGRGTDISLGAGVAEAGGLHVIATGMHESARIDRQLAGRAGRQGDAGSFRKILSMDDELFETAWGQDTAQQIRNSTRADSNLPTASLTRLFLRAQQQLSKQRLRERAQLTAVENQKSQRNDEMGRDYFLAPQE